MKKKLLSLGLAAALSLSLIVPAFASQTYVSSWLETGVVLEESQTFTAPLTPVNKGGRWGYIDQTGKTTALLTLKTFFRIWRQQEIFSEIMWKVEPIKVLPHGPR